ncbi:MAG: hypothetical protein KGY51_11010 [Psychroflexus sp.]|nr:hypothetical protein [Psychroflexus sp.]
MNIKISAFKHVSEANNPYTKDVFKCLERIRVGKSKDKILKYQKTGDEKYKKNLPGFCFSGVFSTRAKVGLKKHSGLLVLDFDGFKSNKDAKDYKDSICDLPYVFSAFISPSGKGVKALVKIPPIPQDHEKYYNAIYKHINSDYLDPSGKDVGRFCFESYDPDIYVNPDCETWTEKEEKTHEQIGVDIEDVKVRLSSEHEIINRLQKWFDKKYGANKGTRNSNLFKYAHALHDFGIDKMVAESHLKQYAQQDFNEKEIQNLINSAYRRKPGNFGSKCFEDHNLKTKIEKQIRSGKSNRKIKKIFSNKVDDVETVIDKIKDNTKVNEFWYYDDKNKIRLSPHKYKFYLEQNNFLKYFPTDTSTFTFIKKEENLIEETNEKRIKDFVLNDLLSRPDTDYGPYDFMAGNPGYFNVNYLSMLKSADINLKEDTKNACYLYYRNCAVKITKDSVKEIDYLDLDGYVWKNQIIDRNYKKTDHHKAEFRTFVWLIANKEVERYNSFQSVIGYLLHSFKTSSKNKAIIFNDETISENPNGGSGKGLFWNALSKMKKVSMIDGKTFTFEKSFPYQTVSADCQILVFDDVRKNFNFESLFSVITEGITLEYKGQDAIKIPVEKSPKILITTNYTVGGVGGSHERRKFEVEMSSYFGVNHTPEDEFKHMLFDDWSEEEWQIFDNYMIACVQKYLKTGLVSHEFQNLDVRKFIKETNMEFYEFVHSEEVSLPEDGTRIYKADLYSQFIQDYPDYAQGKYKLTQKSFKKYLDKYAAFKNIKIKHSKDMNGIYIELYNSHKKKRKTNDEVPF